MVNLNPITKRFHAKWYCALQNYKQNHLFTHAEREAGELMGERERE